jgi:hypothetical protein
MIAAFTVSAAIETLTAMVEFEHSRPLLTEGLTAPQKVALD